MATDHAAIQACIEEIVRSACDAAAALREAVAELKRSMPDYTWVGIYQVRDGELVLGPFLGKPSPHTRIPIGRGVCGAAAAEKQTIVVDDVNADERYLACSLETRSEIVVPIMRGDAVIGEIDIDSDRPAATSPACSSAPSNAGGSHPCIDWPSTSRSTSAQ